MRTAFWKSARVLFNYKRPLSLAMAGAVVSAACFGAGLAAIIPMLTILMGTEADRQTWRQTSADATPPAMVQPAVPPTDDPSVSGASLADPSGQATALATSAAVAPGKPYEAPLRRYLRGVADNPRAFGPVRDAATWAADHAPNDPFRGFVLVMGVIALLTLVGSTARYTHELIVITVVQRAVMVWRLRMFRRLIHTPYEQLMLTGTSDHIARLVADTAVLEGGYRAVLGKTVAELTKGAAALLAALYVDPVLTLIALTAAPPIAILLRKFSKIIRRASRQAMQQRGRIIGQLNESLGGLPVVKVHSAEGYERRRFARATRTLFAQEMKKRQARALSSPVIETLALMAVLGVSTIAAWYMFHSNRPAENLFAVLIMLAAAGNSLKPLTTLQNQIAEADAAASRVLEVVDLPVEPLGQHRLANEPNLPPHRQAIRFEAVRYHYPGKDPAHDAPALNDVTLDIPFGSTVAFVGTNGSGKSTLLSLLPRLICPSAGRVLIDGQDIAHVSLHSLRRQMAFVTQQSVLFEGSIADNIAYGRTYTPRQRIIDVAKAAYADEFIQRLPQGYDTRLGEEGIGLSGGQRQRLCIARALLRDPAILILDEATSQIDADSEAKINQVIRGIRHGRTIFIIAHRLSTVIDADRIIVMQLGQVIDQGTHAQLMARCEPYRTLASTQLQG